MGRNYNKIIDAIIRKSKGSKVGSKKLREVLKKEFSTEILRGKRLDSWKVKDVMRNGKKDINIDLNWE